MVSKFGSYHKNFYTIVISNYEGVIAVNKKGHLEEAKAWHLIYYFEKLNPSLVPVTIAMYIDKSKYIMSLSMKKLSLIIILSLT